MKPRNWEYVGEPVPEINLKENADFIFHLQKSMLLSLVKRDLLTTSQMEQIGENLKSKSAR